MAEQTGGSVSGLASGTLVRTPNGEVAVEALRTGDWVETVSGSPRPIRRISRLRAQAGTDDGPRAGSSSPVRVKREAFGAGFPSTDLILAPGHAVLVTCVDEVLMPVEVFINDATILPDRADPDAYWQVELDAHALLYANGLPCESHLADRMGESCRPYCTDPAVVEGLRLRLCQRAHELGWTTGQVEPDVHLEVDGEVLFPDIGGDRARFVIPAAATEVWLRSRSFVPSDVMGSADTRRLGIQIMSLTVDDGITVQRVIGADDPRLIEGFYVSEITADGAFRWTTGRARLPAEFWQGCNGRLFLKIDFSARHLMGWVAPTEQRSPPNVPGSVGLRLDQTAA